MVSMGRRLLVGGAILLNAASMASGALVMYLKLDDAVKLSKL